MGSYLTPNRINIGVLGLWHLGCIYAASFAKKGFNVRGFDQNQKIINKLKKGIPPIFEPGLEQELKKTLDKKLGFSSFQETVVKRVITCVSTLPIVTVFFMVVCFL